MGTAPCTAWTAGGGDRAGSPTRGQCPGMGASRGAAGLHLRANKRGLGAAPAALMRLCPSVGVCVGQLEVSLRVRLSGFVSVGLLYVSLCPSRLFRVRVSLRPRVLTHPRVPAYVSPRVAASPRVFPAPLRVPAAPPQRSPPACPRASPRRRPSTCPQLRAVRMRGWVGAAPSRTCAVRKGGGGGAAVRTRCQKAVWRRRRACAVMRAALRAVPLMAAAVAGSGAGPKRARTEPPLRIGTHDGTFHCDEALACYLLRLLPRYRVRPRPPRAPPHPGPVPPCGPRPSSGPPRPAGLRGVTEEPPWGPRPRVRDAFGSPILHWGRCGVLSVLLGSSFSAGAALISPAVSLLPPNDHSCVPALCWAPRSHLEATLWSPGRCQSPWSYLGDAFRSPILHWGRTGLPSSLLGYSDPRGGRPYVPISPWRSLTSPVPPCPPPASPHCSAGRRGGADPGPPAPGPVRCGGGCGGRI